MNRNTKGTSLLALVALLIAPATPVQSQDERRAEHFFATDAARSPDVLLLALEDDDLGLLPESRRRKTPPATNIKPVPPPVVNPVTETTAPAPIPAPTEVVAPTPAAITTAPAQKTVAPVTATTPATAPVTETVVPVTKSVAAPVTTPAAKTAPVVTTAPNSVAPPAQAVTPRPVVVAPASTPAPAAVVSTVPVMQPGSVGGVPLADLDSIDQPRGVPDRWHIVDTLGYPRNLFDPYHTNNPLKGDKPVFGRDWFVSLNYTSDTVIEPRYVVTPVGGPTTANSNTYDTLGDGAQMVWSQNFILENVLYKGDTTFRPPDVEFRFTPVININHVTLNERGLVNVDPTAEDSQGTERSDSFVGIQSLYVDVHLRDVSARYDFDSIRFGIQPFTADFRSFLFNDQPFGLRLFGIRDNNRYQYNLAWFRRIEKDTNSGLNDVGLGLRKDDVFLANLYLQDFGVLGFTSEFSLLHNSNKEGDEVYYDDNGFLVRPRSNFDERGHDYAVSYFGYNGDGHFGAINLSTSFYYAMGKETPIATNTPTSDIAAVFAAAEVSKDWDWMRFRVSGLYASSDDNPYDNKSTGYDAILENPQFAGADTSYWIRQAVPLIGGGGVTISGRNGILNSLRSSKDEGQSNFVNPGMVLLGIGGDFDVLPELRVSFNVNSLNFADTTVIETLRQQSGISNNIGTDISVAGIYRPFMTQNIIVRLSGAMLLPGEGYKALYGDGTTPYSVLFNLILNY